MKKHNVLQEGTKINS